MQPDPWGKACLPICKPKGRRVGRAEAAEPLTAPLLCREAATARHLSHPTHQSQGECLRATDVRFQHLSSVPLGPQQGRPLRDVGGMLLKE